MSATTLHPRVLGILGGHLGLLGRSFICRVQFDISCKSKAGRKCPVLSTPSAVARRGMYHDTHRGLMQPTSRDCGMEWPRFSGPRILRWDLGRLTLLLLLEKKLRILQSSTCVCELELVELKVPSPKVNLQLC